MAQPDNTSRSRAFHGPAFGWGAAIGSLGGLIGLGGAEFRLPVLAAIFRFKMLDAIIINLMVSLVTVIFAFLFRIGMTGIAELLPYLWVVANILSGSLIGSWMGVHFATRVNERLLTQVVVVFLVFLSAVLIGHEFIFSGLGLDIPLPVAVVLGFFAGIVIGLFSSMLGVAGGELIIPTILLLYGLDIKVAGSLSLAISIPTILMGLSRYRARQTFGELQQFGGFIGWMAAGSILGALIGALLMVYTPSTALHVLLGIILLISAWKLAMVKLRTPRKAGR
ncbi:permease [Ectothiorhodospira shaposhnikovii]|uniref:sulfite exporter TauE/SafE family protein n=1 Tax=Ectothiorhodospira shaposhnikovii TaxID=1054 RepID=UPI001904620C|nr:sulfite exporter TauE/SafE family protein [Ectothiorhodospira shaposhnikovii]MBK1673670.1 permease [Ectothiorhodospira shaposhnikovii]